MALTDSRTIAIGVIIGLLVGGGVGYLVPQSKINELSMDVVSLEGMVSHLEEVNGELLRSLENAEQDVDRIMFHFDELMDVKKAIEAEFDEHKVLYNEMWVDYSNLIQDYNEVSLEPVGRRIVSEVSGVINGDFEIEEDWVKQGKGGIGWGEAQLHQYETFSTYLTQNIYLDSTDLGIKFDVNPEPLGGTVGLQVNVGDVMVYDSTYTGLNSAFDYESVVIPLDVLLEMREYYELPVEGYYALKFTIPAGPESGALVKIDNVSLVTLIYLPEQPLA